MGGLRPWVTDLLQHPGRQVRPGVFSEEELASGLPKPRPHYMVEALYEEPERGFSMTLFCGCAIEPATGRVVGVSPVYAAGEGGDGAHGMMARLCTDLGRLVTWHLRMGVAPQDLSMKLHEANGGGEVGSGPGQVKFPIHRPGVCLVGLASPLSAIVVACVVAHTDWRSKTAQLAQEGIVGHA